MATVASPQSSNLSNRVEGVGLQSNQSPYTPSPRKLKRLQSASTDELHREMTSCRLGTGESKCKRCGWLYPIPNPNSRQRRHHKKICPHRSSLGSEEEIETSGGHVGPDQINSEQSFVQSRDHEVTDTGKSRKRLPFDEMEQENVTERALGQNGTHTEVDDKLQQASSPWPINSEHLSSGTGEVKVKTSKEKEDAGAHEVPKDDPQEAHSPRTESYLESGSDSGASHESDPSYDMPFESSDIGEASKRDDSLPSDEDMLEEEKKYGASQHQQPHTHLQDAAAESSRARDNRTDSEGEGEGMPVNVASLITKYEQTKSLPSDVDYMALSGNKRSMPFAGSGQGGPLALRSKNDLEHAGEIAPAEETLEGRRLSSGREVEYDLELILKKQKTHELICPVCGSQITDRVIVRKKRRTFSTKNQAMLPDLKEIGSEASDQESNVQAITTGAGSRGTWVDKCLSYLGIFRRDT